MSHGMHSHLLLTSGLHGVSGHCRESTALPLWKSPPPAWRLSGHQRRFECFGRLTKSLIPGKSKHRSWESNPWPRQCTSQDIRFHKRGRWVEGGGARNLNWGQKKNVLRFIVDTSAGSNWHRVTVKAVNWLAVTGRCIVAAAVVTEVWQQLLWLTSCMDLNYTYDISSLESHTALRQ